MLTTTLVLYRVQVADVLNDVLELVRPLAAPVAGPKAASVELQLHDFYGGNGFMQMQQVGRLQYRKDDVRLIAALEAVREPTTAAPGVAAS